MTQNMLVVIARAGTQLGQGAIITEYALKEMVALATTPYLKYREETKDLVWEGPEDAYYEYFHHKSSEQIAGDAITRAMRKS